MDRSRDGSGVSISDFSGSDGSYLATADATFGSDDIPSIFHKQDDESFSSQGTGMLDEVDVPDLLLREYMKPCFSTLHTISEILSSGPMTNGSKKKLARSITVLQNQLDDMDESLDKLIAILNTFVNGLESISLSGLCFSDLVDLIQHSELEQRALINNLVPASLTPAALFTALHALLPHFNAVEAKHPHLQAQFHELLAEVNDVNTHYQIFDLKLKQAIGSFLFPLCSTTISRLLVNMKRACCSSHKSNALSRLRKIGKVGQAMWRLVVSADPFSAQAISEKTLIFAALLQVLLDPPAHRRSGGISLTFNEVGAVLAVLVPVTLVMRINGIDSGTEVYAPVMSVLGSVKVVLGRARRRKALIAWLRDKNVVQRDKVKETRKKGPQGWAEEPNDEDTNSPPGPGEPTDDESDSFDNTESKPRPVTTANDQRKPKPPSFPAKANSSNVPKGTRNKKKGKPGNGTRVLAPKNTDSVNADSSNRKPGAGTITGGRKENDPPAPQGSQGESGPSAPQGSQNRVNPVSQTHEPQKGGGHNKKKKGGRKGQK